MQREEPEWGIAALFRAESDEARRGIQMNLNPTAAAAIWFSPWGKPTSAAKRPGATMPQCFKLVSYALWAESPSKGIISLDIIRAPDHFFLLYRRAFQAPPGRSRRFFPSVGKTMDPARASGYNGGIIRESEDPQMIEQAYSLSKADDKAVERVVMDENLHYLHMVFPKGEGLPEHLSNANLYMTVVRGRLSIGLNDQQVHAYPAGTLLKIPVATRMNVRNLDEAALELIVVKAPAPKG